MKVFVITEIERTGVYENVRVLGVLKGKTKAQEFCENHISEGVWAVKEKEMGIFINPARKIKAVYRTFQVNN